MTIFFTDLSVEYIFLLFDCFNPKMTSSDFLVCSTNKSQKICNFKIIYDKENQKIVTFEKLETENLLAFCL